MGRESDPASLYLDLLKRTLTRLAFPERYKEVARSELPRYLVPLLPGLRRRGLSVTGQANVDLEERRLGRDWPPDAETMIGLPRLDNLEYCVRTIIGEDVPGDLIETGVWRGGASIFMRAALEALGDSSRSVWVADSFKGLPPPDPAYPADEHDRHHTRSELAISAEEVQDNFRRYGMLDHRVRFLKGWFKDTLPSAPIERLSLIRLDGDMYGSTVEALAALYPKLSDRGFVLVDDYGLKGARAAVTDFRRDHNITDPIIEVDWTGAYWRRGGGS